jgi:PAS domain S-box-containing protein
MVDTVNNEQGYLQQILENSPDGVFTIDTNLNIQYVNPAFCRLLGFSEKELLNTSITQYLGDLNILDACMVEVSEKGKCNDQETIFKRKDGSIVHISKNVQAMFKQDGSFKEILVTIRDMTQLHSLNRDLTESKQKLEAYNLELEKTLIDLRATQKQLVEAEKMASLGSLVAGVAHEINTPLGVGVTSVSTMHEELKELQTKFSSGTLTRSFMDDFFENSNKLCAILHQNLYRASELIKSFKQVAVDQSMEELREIDLKEYCDEILKSMGPKFKQTAITISNHCDEGIKFTTYAGAIYQILSNLLINSLVHAYDDEHKEGNIIINAHKNADNIIIDYQDDGKGIPAERQSRIFEPFFTTRRGSGGSGLGLSILYNLVTGSLNGSINVISEERQGTRFNIKIPVTPGLNK